MRALIALLLTLALAYLALLLLLFAVQGRLLYFPTRAIEATPADAGLAYEEVGLRAADGVRLQAWYVPAPGDRGTILFFHGNGGNLSHRLDTLRLLHRLGWSTLILSYRGYGRSEGTPTERGTYLDAEAAWRHLVEDRGIPAERVVVFGRSLGGGVAAWLAERHPPGGLILESTFTSVPDLAAGIYPLLPVRLLVRHRYPTLSRLPRIRAPVLVVHGREDEIIPFRHGQRLYDAAREPKAFLEIRGSHNEGFLLSGESYAKGLAAFLDRIGDGRDAGR